jgi:hypothetical protein
VGQVGVAEAVDEGLQALAGGGVVGVVGGGHGKLLPDTKLEIRVKSRSRLAYLP